MNVTSQQLSVFHKISYVYAGHLGYFNNCFTRFSNRFLSKYIINKILKSYYCLFGPFSASERKCRKYASTPRAVFWGRCGSCGGSEASKSASASLRLEARSSTGLEPNFCYYKVTIYLGEKDNDHLF